jgi:ankyrin repeat protein
MGSLISAAKRGDLIALKEAILSGTDLNSTDSQGWTALFHAAHRGDLEAVRLLIEAGADVNHGKENGFTALFSAVMSGHVETVRALLAAGAEVVPVSGIALRGHAMWIDSKQRQEAILQLLDAASTARNAEVPLPSHLASKPPDR